MKKSELTQWSERMDNYSDREKSLTVLRITITHVVSRDV